MAQSLLLRGCVNDLPRDLGALVGKLPFVSKPVGVVGWQLRLTQNNTETAIYDESY